MSCCFSQTDCKHDNAKSCTNPHTPYKDWQCLNICLLYTSLALGGMTLGVTNIDMTAAYAAIANHGTYTKPVYYTAVYDYKGNLLLDNSSSETHTVLKEQTAWLLTLSLIHI